MEITCKNEVTQVKLRPLDVLKVRDGNAPFEYRMVISVDGHYVSVNLTTGNSAAEERTPEELLSFYVRNFDEVIVIPHEKIKMELGGVLR